MDIMLNGWLLYQTLACRIWARSALLSGQRRLRLPRSAAGRHGARRLAAGDDARASAARGGAAVRRGRRPALVAAAFGPGRAHAHFRRPGRGSPTPPPIISTATGDCAVLDEVVPFLEGPTLVAGRARQLLPADGLGRGRHAVRALRARHSTKALPIGAPRPAVDRHRRLERRHEPRRRRGQGRERLARLAAVRDADRVRSARRGARTRPARATIGGRMPRLSRLRSSARPGTATGTGAAGSTTARRSARRRARSAGSTSSPSPGR